MIHQRLAGKGFCELMSHGVTFLTSLLEIRDGHLIKTSFFSIKSFFKIILLRQLTDSSIPTPPLCRFAKDLFTTTLTNSQHLERNPQSRYHKCKLPTYLPNQPINQPTSPPPPPTQLPKPSPPPPSFPSKQPPHLPISPSLPQPLPSSPCINAETESLHSRILILLMENTLGGGGVRTSVRNCDLLGEFIRWGRWMYGRGGEGRGGCGVGVGKRSWRGGGRGYCRGWVLLLPRVCLRLITVLVM